nr:MAG TPA: hypothetical protein [Caudoviricetes sp.]
MRKGQHGRKWWIYGEIRCIFLYIFSLRTLISIKNN